MTACDILRRMLRVVAAGLLLSAPGAARAIDLSVESSAPGPRTVGVDLVTSDGRTLRFPDDLAGEGTLLLSFTLTGCVAQCPPSDAIMDAVAHMARAEGLDGLTLATLTLNPLDDTPERLEAERAHYLDPSRIFLTGHPADVFAVLDGLAMRPSSGEDHTVRFVRWAPGDSGPSIRDGFVEPGELLDWVRSPP
ncbi:SCO family protein [Antarcticirhabdus aurantiaca]|uniref:SCO family protein n=1 Tax=Antarcticirhabdus aurantiaca TaxID=2606717 RepID=A0ACD4NH65_9HYPH|nr:SCO family protein [Antarcticirhabdus aurantiaca]WAJ26157.1 SCO family protein [Jeongeuplla avenae]